VRGVVLPVLDLRIVLGRPAPGLSHPSVVVMVHAGRLLGLLADGVGAVFHRPSGDLQQLARDTDAASLLEAAVHDEDGLLVSVLSPAALAALPGVPMGRDPQPAHERDGGEDLASPAVPVASAAPVMVMRCGSVGLAIAATAVHTTLSNPRVQASPLAVGACRGVIHHADRLIAAVDLLELCGLGRLDAASARQAFVIELPAGRIAFLVTEVLDIVNVAAAAVMPLPAFAHANAALFAGALAAHGLAETSPAHRHEAEAACLVIEHAALAAHELVAALAGTNTPDAGAQSGTAARAASADGRRMLTYFAGVESASPLEQVAEILPYRADPSIADAGAGAVRGLLLSRGRSIPVLCLSRLTAGVSPVLDDDSCVLVVESAGTVIGFAVPRLHAIEAAQWEPVSARRHLVLVGDAAAQRMLPVLDLVGLATRLADSSSAFQPRLS